MQREIIGTFIEERDLTQQDIELIDSAVWVISRERLNKEPSDEEFAKDFTLVAKWCTRNSPMCTISAAAALLAYVERYGDAEKHETHKDNQNDEESSENKQAVKSDVPKETTIHEKSNSDASTKNEIPLSSEQFSVNEQEDISTFAQRFENDKEDESRQSHKNEKCSKVLRVDQDYPISIVPEHTVEGLCGVLSCPRDRSWILPAIIELAYKYCFFTFHISHFTFHISHFLLNSKQNKTA